MVICKRITLIGFTIIFIIITVDALRCYDCSTYLSFHDNCRFVNETTATKDCPQHIDYCLQYIFTAGDGEHYFIRRCGYNPETDCRYNSICTQCESDLCNCT